MRDIVIFGCGGFGREVLQIILDQNDERPCWRPRGFLVSPDKLTEETVHGFPVAPDIRVYGDPKELDVVIGIGNGGARRQIVAQLRLAGVTSFPPLVHPKAWLGRNILLREGVIVCAGALLTTDITLGEHCHVNIGATIGHDTIVGAYTTISPGVNVSGRVSIGEEADVGSAASIIPGVALGARSVVGASAAVVRDVPDDTTVVGVPARAISRTPQS